MSHARHARRTRSKTATRALLTAGVSAGVAVASTGAASAAGDYTVKKGDTLSEIAQQYHTSWHQLAKVNHLADPDLILIGQQLRLTAPSATTAATTAKAGKHTKKVRVDHVDKSAARHAKARHTKKPTRSAPRPKTSGSAAMTSAWRKVANCESSGNPRAVNPAGYYGLFQFDLRTWRSVGGHGNPISASAAEQYMRAKMLYAKRGASPWPVCGRFLR